MERILSYRKFLGTYKTRTHRIKHLKNYRYLFPIKASSTLAGIVADLIGDGHLQGNPKWRIDFTSKDTNELKRFEKEMKKLFKVKGKIRRCNSNKYSKTYNLAINSSPVARILFLCGVPPGQKVLVPFKIPTWIKKNKGCFRKFCKRLFSCEGGILYEPNRKLPRIRLELWKNKKLIENGEKFIEEIADYINKYFNIKSTVLVQNKVNIRKDGIVTKPIRLCISGDSVIAFYRKVGFEGKKQKDLKALINK